MKKILLAALTALSINTFAAAAEERPDQGDDYSVEIHKECFLHSVIVKQVEENDLLHGLTYMKNEFYDGITGQKINLMNETIYIDDDNNRWYFPYDNSKFHYHEEE